MKRPTLLLAASFALIAVVSTALAIDTLLLMSLGWPYSVPFFRTPMRLALFFLAIALISFGSIVILWWWGEPT